MYIICYAPFIENVLEKIHYIIILRIIISIRSTICRKEIGEGGLIDVYGRLSGYLRNLMKFRESTSNISLNVKSVYLGYFLKTFRCIGCVVYKTCRGFIDEDVPCRFVVEIFFETNKKKKKHFLEKIIFKLTF